MDGGSLLVAKRILIELHHRFLYLVIVARVIGVLCCFFQAAVQVVYGG